MIEPSNGASAIRPGLNAPSPVRRVLILGYYDGATDGVIELGPVPEVFEFRQSDEVFNPDGVDRRTFDLRPLPADSMARLVAAISPYIEPAWPTWAPVWRFPDESARQAVEAQVGAILSAAERPLWQIETDDTIAFSHFHARQLESEPAA